mmetsp:Transcript_2744/g.6069  ORF Transcript_2744/g.6069 Transcript_2744/m.6069 type:complete len:212 (+) Transcript_2744:166-801(+)
MSRNSLVVLCPSPWLERASRSRNEAGPRNLAVVAKSPERCVDPFEMPSLSAQIGFGRISLRIGSPWGDVRAGRDDGALSRGATARRGRGMTPRASIDPSASANSQRRRLPLRGQTARRVVLCRILRTRPPRARREGGANRRLGRRPRGRRKEEDASFPSAPPGSDQRRLRAPRCTSSPLGRPRPSPSPMDGVAVLHRPSPHRGGSPRMQSP